MGDELQYDRRKKEDEDEDDDDDDEETGRRNGLFGFMFGNVDDAGDLDVDYLDEDAKGHLAVLADKLGSSLTAIDFSIRPSKTIADADEEDYDEKAEDAVDYEDIDEQYEGPETQNVLSEEDYLLAVASVSNLEHRNSSVFDEENYDEDEDEQEGKGLVNSSELKTDLAPEETTHFARSVEDENLAVDLEDSEPEEEFVQEPLEENNIWNLTRLPTLCTEDGSAVLRFSEIFGMHEPLKKGEKRNRRYPEKRKALESSDSVEEDEEDFLRGSCEGLFTSKHATLSTYDGALLKECDTKSALYDSRQSEEQDKYFLSSEPMKKSGSVDEVAEGDSPSCPELFHLDQQNWEDEIVWGDSPLAESCTVSGPDYDGLCGIEKKMDIGQQDLVSEVEVEVESKEKDHSLFLCSCHVSVEPLCSRKFAGLSNLTSKNIHPQLLRFETSLSFNDSTCLEGRKVSDSGDLCPSDAIRKFNEFSLQNVDMLEDSWLDDIIWDTNKSISKPKLIFNLRDEQMLFEILYPEDVRHLQLHTGAMTMKPSMKASGLGSIDRSSQGGSFVGCFNISNDMYYSNKEASEADPQQLKSHSKKRAGVKVLHSIPALKLQTMKPKLSNKEIANFHRPKALWYPHDNGVAAKKQGVLSTKGPMKIILKSMGGRGSKLHVDAEETISSVIAKASKKLDFKSSEKVQVFYFGKVLEDGKSLAEQNVRPNSVLHLVRTKIHLWPRAQKLPGENKSLRPPGAFRKMSDLSVKDGHVFLMEYCEERPLLLGNVGMGARLCTYFNKSAPDDQIASLFHNGSHSLGNVLTLDRGDKSPFLGDLKIGCRQSCIETNMYKAPIFPHKLASTDYLLVRSAKGKLSLRRIDRIDVVGQQEPRIEVLSPGTKSLQTYIGNRLLVYLYREFCVNEKRGSRPCVRADELAAVFSNMSEPFLRKRLKLCADLQRGTNGELLWVMRHNFRIPLEEELRRMVTPENVCAYESMQAGLYRLKRLGICRFTHPVSLSSAMNQLPDEAIAFAAASHIQRELQITPWNLSGNFVACTNQERENIERLEITGVGDPSGRGLGFSYVRVAPKATLSSAMAKKKKIIPLGASTVTGTDADLRRLSMGAAREVLLKFKVPEEQIAKQNRWRRIDTIRKLSSEQPASGIKVDASTINKYARGGQRMSFTQLQQQTREKCNEIWNRQVLSLSAADGDENDSDSEPNSDLDSFAGDLESLLDAEECGTAEGECESKHYKADSVKGIKMKRHSSQPLAEEENEDEAAEARELCRMLMDDDEPGRRNEKNQGPGGREFGSGRQSGFGSENAKHANKTNTVTNQINFQAQPDGPFTCKEKVNHVQQVENIISKRSMSAEEKGNLGGQMSDAGRLGSLKEKTKELGDRLKVIKEKKQSNKPVREFFVCGACGEVGHMRTNKNCPRYGEVLSIDSERASDKPNFLEPEIRVEADTETRSGSRINKIVISKRMKPEDVPIEPPPKPSIIIRPPMEKDRDQPFKKIKIKPPKEIIDVDEIRIRQDIDSGLQEDFMKVKKMNELSSLEKRRKQESKRLAEEMVIRKANEGRRNWEEEEKKRKAERMQEERGRFYEEEKRMQAEQQRLVDSRRCSMWEEMDRIKVHQKKKKNRRPEMEDEYLDEHKLIGNDRRLSIRTRAAKRTAGLVSYGSENGPQSKRRRGGAGEVGLANILEGIVDSLKGAKNISYLFELPVSKKDAPDYLDFVKRPMDLSTIREKVRKMEYKSREDFRHDVWQITFNAHKYNDGRHTHIPPLADQLLELCDYFLEINKEHLTEAEAGIGCEVSRTSL